MPRAAVKLPAVHEPVPGWWADAFHKRQATLRMLIIRHLRRAGRAMTAGELGQQSTSYWAEEHRQARDDMVNRGELVRFARAEPRQFGSVAYPRTYTYYDLAERQA